MSNSFFLTSKDLYTVLYPSIILCITSCKGDKLSAAICLFIIAQNLTPAFTRRFRSTLVLGKLLIYRLFERIVLIVKEKKEMAEEEIVSDSEDEAIVKLLKETN